MNKSVEKVVPHNENCDALEARDNVSVAASTSRSAPQEREATGGHRILQTILDNQMRNDTHVAYK